MNPVVIPFHCDTGDAGVLQWLQGFDGAGEGAGEDLAGVKQVTGDEDEIDPHGDGVGHDSAEHTEEVFVAFGLAAGGAIGFPEVDVGGVEKCYQYILDSILIKEYC